MRLTYFQFSSVQIPRARFELGGGGREGSSFSLLFLFPLPPCGVCRSPVPSAYSKGKTTRYHPMGQLCSEFRRRAIDAGHVAYSGRPDAGQVGVGATVC